MLNSFEEILESLVRKDVERSVIESFELFMEIGAMTFEEIVAAKHLLSLLVKRKIFDEEKDKDILSEIEEALILRAHVLYETRSPADHMKYWISLRVLFGEDTFSKKIEVPQ